MRMGLSKTKTALYKHKATRIYLYLVFILSLILSFVFLLRLRPAFLRVFTPYAINIGSDSINFTVADYFQKNKYNYSDFVTLSYNQNNEITSLQTDSALMNKVKAELSIYLQEEIIKLKTTELSIPFGNIFDNIVLHGMGPDIKITVKATDITDLNFNDCFEEAGINQVRHKIFIDAYVTITVNCASMSKSEVIHDTIPVAETLIVGQVPRYYSINGNSQFIPTDMEE